MRRSLLIRIPIFLVVTLAAVVTQAAAGQLDSWRTDFKHQPLPARPSLEARYKDAARAQFVIDAQNYRAQIDLSGTTGQRIRSFKVNSYKRSDEILADRGVYLSLVDAAGRVYSTLNAREASRVNIYRRGPYYIETHWLDVQLCDLQGKPAPVKGEVVFYSYPEKTHVGVILRVTGPIEVKNACMTLEFDAETCVNMTRRDPKEGVRINDFVLLKRANNVPSCSLIYPVPHGIDDVIIEKTDGVVRVCNYIYSDETHGDAAAKWNAGDKPSCYFELFPLAASEVSEEMEAEVMPLLSGCFAAMSGRTLGYDPIRGCYKVQTDNPGDSNHHYYQSPNDCETATFSIKNNDQRRKVYILHETRNIPGGVECGVVLDEQGNTLPIMVQISKNFAHEKEEPFYNPGDMAFSETFFPLYLAEGETRKLTSLHLYQNWGIHPLKQFSSLGAWMDYYHMSTGVTETTCYVPFLFGGLDGVSIGDLRPMSQPFWETGPQHYNVAGHSFLRYYDEKGTWHFIEYVGTTFRSTGPNWADMSINYLSDDGRAKMQIDVFELPQTDELRNFIHMRVDFLEDIVIKDADFAHNVRLLNISSWVQRLRYTHVAYGGPSGEPSIVPIGFLALAGEPLPHENSFVTIYPNPRGANAFIVRSFEGRIGGNSVAPGVSLFGRKDSDTVLMLVPVTGAKEIKAGDYLDINLFLMPYGGGTEDEQPAQKAANDYGINTPRVTSVTAGKKLLDFPTRIELDDKGRAEFSVAGGLNCIPIIVEGANDYASLRLYNADGEKKLIEHSRPGENDGYQVFVREDGTFGYVFLVNADGGEHKYVAE